MTDEPRSNMPAMLASGVVLGVHRGWIRAVDVGSLVALLGLLIALALRLWPSAKGLGGWLAAVGLASYVVADFVSGVFHWMGDTWGTPATPVVGKGFVRPVPGPPAAPRAPSDPSRRPLRQVLLHHDGLAERTPAAPPALSSARAGRQPHGRMAATLHDG